MNNMHRILVVLLVVFLSSNLLAQLNYERKVISVPKVDPGALTIDGVMDESVWNEAAEVNLISSSGYEFWANYYGRELPEPDYEEYFVKMLWAQDTLYLFIHIDEIVNDSTNLFWDGKWNGDQLFLSISNRLGIDLHPNGQYNGNCFTVPDGPYYFLIMGDQLTLNGGDTVWVPDEYLTHPDNYFMLPDPNDYARMATSIDYDTGIWNIELAIYNRAVAAQSKLGFNLGGSTGADGTIVDGEATYAYYTWQPNVPDDPFTDPPVVDEAKALGFFGDPGTFNLQTSLTHAVLVFEGDEEVFVRKEVQVPVVDPGALTIDGVMDESVWDEAAEVNLISSSGYEFWANYYGRELPEPDYEEYFVKMLWAQDTLYLFIHIDEIVNDSTNLFWDGKWNGDQLFLSISNRLGIDLHPNGQYNGNCFTVPDGPYYFLIMGDQLTLNGGDTVWVPDEYLTHPDNYFMLPDPNDYARMATSIDYDTGIWNIELAIYNPSITYQSALGLNLGGSTGADGTIVDGEATYAYYTWQPNVPDDPFTDPPVVDYAKSIGFFGDPGTFNLQTSMTHSVLNFVNEISTSVWDNESDKNIPVNFSLDQNFPNPFNPSTTIRINVSKSVPVSLRIYDSLGRLVSTLINNQTLSVGSHLVNWNASNLASGVYFYSLETAGSLITKKMMLLK